MMTMMWVLLLSSLMVVAVQSASLRRTQEDQAQLDENMVRRMVQKALDKAMLEDADPDEDDDLDLPDLDALDDMDVSSLSEEDARKIRVVRGLWNNIKTAARNAWQEIKTGVKSQVRKGWETLKNKVKQKAAAFLSGKLGK